MSKIKVCLVGCGRIATLNVLGYKDNPDAELYAVCDLNRERAQAFAAEHGATKVYCDYAEVLQDPEIQVVDLLVPHHLHCKMTVQACEAGKHVSVQKPMAMSLEECDIMIGAAKKAGVKLKVYENFIFYPPYVKAKAMIDQGVIGDLQSIRIKMNAGVNKSGWKVSPDTWAWRMEESTSGGGELVFDDGNHKFSIARYFMGEPDSVFAFIGRTDMEGVVYEKKDGTKIQFYQDAPSVITWTCKDGNRCGVFDISWSKDMEIHTEYYACDERVEITGSKGVIWITRCTGKMLQVPTLILYKDGSTTEYNNLRDDWADSFIDSTRDFIEAIKNDRDPVLTGEDGREVLKFSLAAIRAAELKRPVEVDSMDDYKKGAN